MDSQRKHTGQRGPALGIDLGATATLAAIYVPGQPEPMLVRPHPDLPEYHDPWLPSLVCLTDSEPLVGEHARRYIRNPRGRDRALLIRCAKREMAFANRLYRLGNQSHSPIDISAILLRHMRQAAASQLGCSVDALREAVITVPAYFGQGERKNTRTAGEKAGFQQVHLLDEPLAATIGLRINETEGDNLVLVVHLGGATFDVTLLRAGQAVPHGGIYEVSRDGDGFLGGIDWDRAIAMFALTHTDRPWDWERRVCDPRLGFLDPSNILLFEPCEHVKRQFCAANPPSSIRFQFTDLVDMQSYQVTMTHAEFLQHTRELRQRCIDVCSRLLREVPDQELRGLRRPPANLLERLWPRRVKQLEWGDIRRICFVGGSSRIHSLRHDIRNCWPRASREPELDERPELQAVFGAAYCAARPELVKQLEQMGLRCPHTLGVWHYPAPRRSLWERLWGRPLGSSVQRNREQDLESRKKFWPLILKNQRIPAAPRVRATVTGRCSKFLAVLVEQRIDPRDPNGVEYRELGELIVACERPAPERQACAVDVELKYHSDRDLTFYASIGGAVQLLQLRTPDALVRERQPIAVHEARIGDREAPTPPSSAYEESAALRAAPPSPSSPQGDASRSESPEVINDRLRFSITSTAVMISGNSYPLDVWAHLDQQRREVLDRARQQAAGVAFRVHTEGPYKVARGTLLTVRVRVQGLGIKPARKTILWDGEIGNASFIVTVPADSTEGSRMGAATLYADNLQIAALSFVLHIGPQSSPCQLLPAQERRIRTAFASYASDDRDKVLARIQGIQKGVPDMDIFLDVARLRSGDNWQLRLRDEIIRRDVLYLFWSAAAKASSAVTWEWKCALRERGIEFIDPVPLVSPEEVPPPPELAAIHFNDWVLAYMNCSERPGTAET